MRPAMRKWPSCSVSALPRLLIITGRMEAAGLTLADPEGNEFDVLRGDSEFIDPYAHMIT